MSAGIYSKRQNFDNLSYISDGRDRISYINDPYAAAPSRDSTRDGNRIILQPTELTRSGRENNTSYSYRPGQENIYAYNNAAFRYLRKNIFFSFFLFISFFQVILVVLIHMVLLFDHSIQIYMLFKNHLKHRNIVEKVNKSSFFFSI
jgi:hypothetical protein